MKQLGTLNRFSFYILYQESSLKFVHLLQFSLNQTITDNIH